MLYSWKNSHHKILRVCYERVKKSFIGDTIKAKRANFKVVVTTKQSTYNFSRTIISYPDMHRYVCIWGGKKCWICGKLGALCFVAMPILKLASLSYYQKYSVLLLTSSKYLHARQVPFATDQESNVNKLSRISAI